jgi:hypothetical protein
MQLNDITREAAEAVEEILSLTEFAGDIEKLVSDMHERFPVLFDAVKGFAKICDVNEDAALTIVEVCIMALEQSNQQVEAKG